MINLGLSRIQALLSRLPQPTFKAIHIAGTNGKGSVAAYLSSLFLRYPASYLSRDSEHGLRIGRFTSPHLIDRWDCITINDKPVSESLFLSAEEYVKSTIRQGQLANTTAGKSADALSYDAEKTTVDESIGTKGTDLDEEPSEFELLTATAFTIFTQQQCQIAIIECGLGGRLDATNALPASNVRVSVITKIGLDHQGLLGNTVEDIAREKAGIIKDGAVVVMDGTNSRSVIDAVTKMTKDGKVWVRDMLLTVESDRTRDLNIPAHTKQNLEVALSAFHFSYLGKFYELEYESIERGEGEIDVDWAPIIEQVLNDSAKSYTGRLQYVDVSPLLTSPPVSALDSTEVTALSDIVNGDGNGPNPNTILLDGAHNPQSAAVLRSYVDGYTGTLSSSSQHSYLVSSSNVTSNLEVMSKPAAANRRVIWVLAMSRGKDISQILSILVRPGDKVVTASFGAVDGMPWVRCVEQIEIANSAREIMKAIDRQHRNDNDARQVEVGSDDNMLHNDVIHHEGDIKNALCLAFDLKYRLSAGREIKPDVSQQQQQQDVLENDGQVEDPMIVVAGSLYLVSDLLRALREADRISDSEGLQPIV